MIFHFLCAGSGNKGSNPCFLVYISSYLQFVLISSCTVCSGLVQQWTEQQVSMGRYSLRDLMYSGPMNWMSVISSYCLLNLLPCKLFVHSGGNFVPAEFRNIQLCPRTSLFLPSPSLINRMLEHGCKGNHLTIASHLFGKVLP
jgi:hypothetical protein